MRVEESTMFRDLSSLFNEETGSDIKITVHGRNIFTHQIFLRNVPFFKERYEEYHLNDLGWMSIDWTISTMML